MQIIEDMVIKLQTKYRKRFGDYLVLQELEDGTDKHLSFHGTLCSAYIGLAELEAKGKHGRVVVREE